MTTTIEALLTREAIDAVRKPLPDASLLPPVVYTSPDVFGLERDHMFQNAWLPVCHVSQLSETGSYVGRVVAEEPVLALRNRDGEIHVFSNVCRHRNAVLATGEGTCKGRISCPYHGWTYGLDGRLLAAPFMDATADFDRKDFGLREIRSEIWHGFVFINLQGDAPALSPQLAGLEGFITPYEFAETVAVPLTSIDADWNWKLSLENFTEAYHQPWVHTHTAEAAAPAAGARYYNNDGAPWSAFLIPNAEEISAFAMGKVKSDAPLTADAPPISLDEGAVIFNIYPYFHALATPNATLWLDFEISDAGHHRLIWRMLFTKEEVAQGVEGPLEQVRGFMAPVIAEDVTICSGVGAGVRSRLAEPGRLSYMEKCVHQFHQWWLGAAGA